MKTRTLFPVYGDWRAHLPLLFAALLALLACLMLAGCVSVPPPAAPAGGVESPLTPLPTVPPPELTVSAPSPGADGLSTLLALTLSQGLSGADRWAEAGVGGTAQVAITTPLTLLSALSALETEAKPASPAPNKVVLLSSLNSGAFKRELATSRSATLIVENRSSRAVCYLFISSTASDSWGEDWLGEGEMLSPGATRSFNLPAGEYDAQALDCEGEVIAEVYGGTISGRTTWEITDETRKQAEKPAPQPRSPEPAQPAPQPRSPEPARPATAPVTLDGFLCCGRTAGETRIWGISYPRGWQVTLLPENPDYFLGAMFADPRSTMRILIIPSGWTQMGTVMDTGDVDQYLDGLTATRAQQSPGFQEFYRRPLPGLPGRVWAGTWKERGRQYWESYTVMVTPMPYVEGMPRGGLNMTGLSAESSEWAQASAIYEAMLGTMQVQVIRTGPAYQPPQPGASDDPVEKGAGETGKASTTFWELVFCAKKCDWEWIDVNSQPAGKVWECSDGCIGQLSQVPCTQDQCR